jgi:hypothetical protein
MPRASAVQATPVRGSADVFLELRLRNDDRACAWPAEKACGSNANGRVVTASIALTSILSPWALLKSRIQSRPAAATVESPSPA